MTLPTGPRRPPLLQTLAWLRSPISFWKRQLARHGDPFTVRLFGFPKMVVVSDPHTIRDIFAARREQVYAGVANDLLEPLVGRHSLLLLDGDRHFRHRKLLMPPLHGRRMRAYGDLIRDATREIIAQWRPGEEVSVHEAFTALSLRVIARAVFGIDTDKAQDALELLQNYIREARPEFLFVEPLQWDLGPWSIGGKMKRRHEAFHALIQELIDARRSDPDPDAQDILTLLLSARDEDGEPMADEELRDELITLLVAGHETTATSLAWAVGWIQSNPGVARRLQAELDAVAPETPSDDLAKLPYLDAVCSETLRLVPVVPVIARYVQEDGFEAGGRAWPRGILLAPCVYLLHHRPELYPEPEVFRPERFLERKFGSHEYIPFGGGNRRCIGEAFARYEMKVALATLYRERKLAPGVAPAPVRRNVTLTPRASTVTVLG